MRSRTAVDSDLIYVRRHEDVLFTITRCLGRDSGSGNLQAGIQDRWMNPIGTAFTFRHLRNTYFTEHISVVPPQLSNALKEGAVLDTVFAQSRVIVLSRHLFQTSSLDLRERLPPCRKDATVSLGRNSAR